MKSGNLREDTYYDFVCFVKSVEKKTKNRSIRCDFFFNHFERIGFICYLRNVPLYPMCIVYCTDFDKSSLYSRVNVYCPENFVHVLPCCFRTAEVRCLKDTENQSRSMGDGELPTAIPQRQMYIVKLYIHGCTYNKSACVLLSTIKRSYYRLNVFGIF